MNILDFVEEQEAWYFSIEGPRNGDSEFWYKKICGLQQRSAENRIIRSIDLGSLNEARTLIQPAVTSAALKLTRPAVAFNPAKILRDNRLLLDTIQKLDPIEWKVIFRARHTGRIILRPNTKENKKSFTLYSILVKLRLKDQREFIQVGEGSVQGLSFNQDGLCARLRRIVENHRQSRPVRFSGKVPVILSAGDGAIFFHELLGHSLEADYIYRNESPLKTSQIGKPIVSPNVTLSTRMGPDQGELEDHFFKSMVCDDEGETMDSPVLVEKGILRRIITDSYYQSKLGLDYCGHCRTENFTRPPMPRNFALYLHPGTYAPAELMETVKYGIYAGEFGEGKVFFHKNLFHFHIRDAQLIENGKLTAPLGSVQVQGHIVESLNSVEMVANDFRFDKGTSYCYKDGQTLNVRVGQPTVKIGNLSVNSLKGA